MKRCMQMCLVAAAVLAAMPGLLVWATAAVLPRRAAHLLAGHTPRLTLLLCLVLSASRITAILGNYGAPMQIYRKLPEVPPNLPQRPAPLVNADGPWCRPAHRLEWTADAHQAAVQISAVEENGSPSTLAHVCIGAEWYRFPSAFFLPSPAYRLAFIPSSFSGLLPTAFDVRKACCLTTCSALRHSSLITTDANQPGLCQLHVTLWEACMGLPIACRAHHVSPTS